MEILQPSLVYVSHYYLSHYDPFFLNNLHFGYDMTELDLLFTVKFYQTDFAL